MAGVKGRSGGARPNSGPKSKLSVARTRDPVKFLLMVMNDPCASPQLRVRAAIAAAQYENHKRGPKGKKDGQKDAAAVAAAGRFAPAKAPQLHVVPTIPRTPTKA